MFGIRGQQTAKHICMRSWPHGEVTTPTTRNCRFGKILLCDLVHHSYGFWVSIGDRPTWQRTWFRRHSVLSGVVSWTAALPVYLYLLPSATTCCIPRKTRRTRDCSMQWVSQLSFYKPSRSLSCSVVTATTLRRQTLAVSTSIKSHMKLSEFCQRLPSTLLSHWCCAVNWQRLWQMLLKTQLFREQKTTCVQSEHTCRKITIFNP